MSQKEREELRQRWAGLVAEFRASGLGPAQWCRQNGHNVRHLHYWLAKFRMADASTTATATWLPIPVESDRAAESPGALVLVRVGRVAIEVQAGFDPDLLRAVVRTLA